MIEQYLVSRFGCPVDRTIFEGAIKEYIPVMKPGELGSGNVEMRPYAYRETNLTIAYRPEETVATFEGDEKDIQEIISKLSKTFEFNKHQNGNKKSK